MKTVLVIEDDEPLCILLSKIFSKHYKVICMHNGFDAWSWLTDGNHADIIVSDINMPALDGDELLENLSNSALFRTIPVIILSGLKDARRKEHCMQLGARAFLHKPFEPNILLETVKRVLNPQKSVHV
jgi:two-component system, chemotaxis family, chemotaxis protein CheY